ncbi:MAG: glycosyltransferase [Lentisphaeria bacterium]|nr:glycosyltransferase [Lentisphaeria bacterium]
MADTQFSILIPVYNGEKTIARAVDSALAQTCGDFELLICDDGSTDGTGAILARYAERDSRIRVLKHERNRGGLCARNTLIRAFSGEYCVWLDADDELGPDFLLASRQTLERENWDIIHFIHEERDLDGSKYLPDWKAFRYRAKNLFDIFLSAPNHLGLWGKAIRGEVMKKAIAPDVRTLIDDMFLALPIFFFASSYILKTDRPMYTYYLGTGYWSPLRNSMTLEKIRKLFILKQQLAAYYSAFLKTHGLTVTADWYIFAIDLGVTLFDILKLESHQERETALLEFQKYFKISLTPAPYAPTFYPPGCEPKKFSYTLNQTGLKL